MKLSTRIKKTIDPQFQYKPIRMMVDCGKTENIVAETDFIADKYHATFLAKGYKLLPQECPVINGNEIVMHYTSTTYRDWCNA